MIFQAEKSAYFAGIIANSIVMNATIAIASNPLERVFHQQGFFILPEKMSKQEFEVFALQEEDLQMERESDGTVTIMPLVKGGSGKREAKVITFVNLWQMQTELGEVYSSATGFELPDGKIKAPDTAWVSDERLSQLTDDELENSFIPIPPDFVVEVRSMSDRIKRVKIKMEETWMANGVRLGWLIDPYEEKVYIYRESGENEVVEGFTGKKLSGEDVMPGLEVPLDKLKIKKRH